MTCPIGTFDAASVIVAVTFEGTTTRITGFGDGDYVTVEPATEKATVQTGADGSHIANFTANNGHNIVLNTQAQSASNAYLKQLCDLRAQFEISISSPDTGESGYSTCAIITNSPGFAFGETAGNRDWSIFAGDWLDSAVEYA